MKIVTISFLNGFFNITCFASLLLLFGSCHRDEIEGTSLINPALIDSNLTAIDPSIGNLIQCQFDTNGALQSEFQVILEEDIVISLDEVEKLKSNPVIEFEDRIELLLNSFESNKDSILPRQYVLNANTLVDINDVDNIEYYIDPSVGSITPGGADWVSAIGTALGNWEAVSDCRVNFTQVQNNDVADLSFHADLASEFSGNYSCMANIPVGAWAKAAFPQSNNIGRYISINDNPSTTPSLSNKRWIIRHEIGHSMGLRHSNVAGEQSVGMQCYGLFSGLNLIEGTPENDDFSVMKTGSLLTISLSTNDRKAIRYMYPESYATPIINSVSVSSCGSCGSNFRNITFNVNASGTAPYVVAVRRYPLTNNTSVQTYLFYETPSGITSHTVVSPTGSWRFKIWRINYGSYSKVSSYRTVSIQ